MEETYICTADKTIIKCEYRNKEGLCTINKGGCGFRNVKGDKINKQEKPSKWYEKYYK